MLPVLMCPPADPARTDGETNAATNAAVRRLLADLDGASPGERDHAERVAVYAVATGHALGLADGDLRTLRLAALLHDVGKVRLDRATLRKLGTLSDAELAEMRRHADEGAAVLASLPALAGALPAIRAHHERFDGSGYPDGLAGDAIPLGARVVGLCESFDVASFGMAWTPRVETSVALTLLRAGRGVQWCPAVLDAFLGVQPLIQPLGLAS